MEGFLRLDWLRQRQRQRAESSVTPPGRKVVRPTPTWDYAARDILSTPVIVCREDARLEEVAELLAERKISGMPVVNRHGDVVGMISRGDLSRTLSPCGWLPVANPLPSAGFWKGPGMPVLGARQAQDVMSWPVVVAHLDTPTHTLIQILVQAEIDRVPIVDNGSLVGVVTRGDVLAAITGLGREAPGPKEAWIAIGSRAAAGLRIEETVHAWHSEVSKVHRSTET